MAVIYKGDPTTNTGNYYKNDEKNTGGHSIKDNGTTTTTRESLNFIDLDIQDNSTDNSTDISAHELTNEEMAEIFANPPGTPTQQQGSNTTGGHTIKDNGTDMTTRSALNFVDFDLSDNLENDDTKVSAHRLTSEELGEILSEPPATSSNLPVLFDERGTEYQVGWYILSDGTKKPVYEKTITKSNFQVIDSAIVAHGISNVDVIYIADGYFIDNTNYVQLPMIWTNSYNGLYANSTNIVFKGTGTWGAESSRTLVCNVRYTKTTDTPI